MGGRVRRADTPAVARPAAFATASTAALALALAVLLGACGGGEAPPPASAGRAPLAAPVTCAPADQRDWLHTYMRDQYYWPDHLATPNAKAGGMDGFFRSMLYQPVDRFSYTQTATEFNQFYSEGTRTGYGYTLVWADAEQTAFRVRSTEPLSPVGLAGLSRGDLVLQIDGYTPYEILAGALPRVTTEGVPRSFVVVDAATGRLRRFSVNSANFALTPVPVASVIELATAQGRKKVAYMAYHEFIIASETGLDRGFSHFIRSGATELVLDLRYNGGGSVIFARALASMIGGRRLDGKTFVDLRFNANHASWNVDIPFTTNVGILPGPVLEGLQRVVVITSAATASASELVINALQPFMPVVLVGETSYGKPYGFAPKEACGTVYSAVAFESFNAVGAGGFTAGFAPTCEAEDDLAHALGDPAEKRLATALYYLVNGVCPARPPVRNAGLARAKGPGGGDQTVFGEVAPAQMVLD